ncbi:phage tail protein [Enterococcus hulanensis]|uniref:Phage tail protein n=1 Tax=Enterococcus hulanensis TaxID=2559929 RepID=A0ABU3F1G6_9ENTE|nr:phage tail protein [Enterococcus hulanensis]MDT2600984.1 phage tail protein [Enterococcus hulanensis]MDT2610534.1 phage tail protein [Enterococcus hulanensis]MDT2617261.1 phage tail protein [Enterococcus hulanensis]
MTVFKNVKSEEFIALTELTYSHKVNGEKSIKGTIYSGEEVISGIDRGWSMEFQGEIYSITYALPVDNGDSIIVEFDAIHEFFFKMGKSSVYNVLNGSNTAKTYLDHIFNGSGYNYSLEVALSAFEKQNFGLKNRLALFNDFINSTSTEFKVLGKTVTIVEKVGSDLSTIVRKGFNMQELGLEHNIGDFVTYAKGFGAFKDPEDESKGRLEVTYKSPLAEIYGILEADPVVDERYTITESMLARLKELVESSYSISVSLTVEDLQKAGYKYAFPEPGDYISAINSDLDFQQKIRIVGIDQSIDVLGELLDKTVTCSSLNLADQKNQADANNSQNWSDIANGLKPIPNEWLTNAIQNATNALLAAQTELKFTSNGILAIEKGNSNRLVVMNSAGVGVSTDGGKTFENALTAEGVNASAITTGVLRAINIIGVSISGSSFETTNSDSKVLIHDGGVDAFEKGNKLMTVKGTGLYVWHPANNSRPLFSLTRAGSNSDPFGILGLRKGQGFIIAGKTSNNESEQVYQPMISFNPDTMKVGLTNAVFSNDVDGNNKAIKNVWIEGLYVPNNSTANFWSPLDMHGFPIYNQSDIRLKENIEDTKVNGIAETKKLNFVEFDRRQNYQSKEPNMQPNSARELGLIAQYSPFLSAKSQDDNYLRLDMNKQIMLNSLTNKQLIEIIDRQEERLSRLEKRLGIEGE